MMTIGIYFAFIIFVMGTIVAGHDVSEEERQKFFNDVLETHNGYRRRHYAEPLKLDEKMCNLTQTYMDNLKTNPLEKLSDEYGSSYYSIPFDGEPKLNKIRELSGKIAVREWYRNGQDYDYTKEPLSSSKTELFNLFTQIVWKKTKLIGIGFVINNGNFEFVVIYSPAGNIEGEYKDNVSRPKKTKPKKAGKTEPKKAQKTEPKKAEKTEPGSSSDPKNI